MLNISDDDEVVRESKILNLITAQQQLVDQLDNALCELTILTQPVRSSMNTSSNSIHETTNVQSQVASAIDLHNKKLRELIDSVKNINANLEL